MKITESNDIVLAVSYCTTTVLEGSCSRKSAYGHFLVLCSFVLHCMVIVPDTEKTLSAGMEVAGIHKSCFANFDK